MEQQFYKYLLSFTVNLVVIMAMLLAILFQQQEYYHLLQYIFRYNFLRNIDTVFLDFMHKWKFSMGSFCTVLHDQAQMFFMVHSALFIRDQPYLNLLVCLKVKKLSSNAIFRSVTHFTAFLKGLDPGTQEMPFISSEDGE